MIMAKLNKTDFGRIIISDPGSDKPILEIGTLQCCHCGCHWFPQPGSGRVRGWCMRCNGPICGPNCARCVPLAQYLDNIEQGRPEDFVSVKVSVPKMQKE